MEYQIIKVVSFLKTRFCSLKNYVRFGSGAEINLVGLLKNSPSAFGRMAELNLWNISIKLGFAFDPERAFTAG